MVKNTVVISLLAKEWGIPVILALFFKEHQKLNVWITERGAVECHLAKVNTRASSFAHTNTFSNSYSSNKGIHDRDSLSASDLNQHRLIEKVYQPLKTEFHNFSNHLEVRQNYSAYGRRVFTSPFCVWKCGKTRYFVFHLKWNQY